MSRAALAVLGCAAAVLVCAVALLGTSSLGGGARALLSSVGKRVDCPSQLPSSACLPAAWKCSDSEVNGEFWPSRSTHYGRTDSGACAFAIAPNCRTSSDTGCQDVPADIFADPAAGKYAAPQGDYYSQTGSYISCGECFEVKCADKQCTSREPVVLRIADSCPCKDNLKWCCAAQSECSELGLSTDGSAHCPKSAGNTTWDNARSIHLDLNDLAMAQVTAGKDSGSTPGVINTFARRVSCKPKGNVYMLTNPSLTPQDCYLVHPQQAKCFSWFAVTPLNVAGAGTVTSVQLYATRVVDGKAVQQWIDLALDSNSADKPQEQFGQFKAPTGVQAFFPMQFKLRNRYGQEVTTQVLEASAWKRYWDSGVQFPPIPAQSPVAGCDKPTQASADDTVSVPGGASAAARSAALGLCALAAHRLL
eukprot:m51a1_g7745 hypothetical protein (420) ;mRNA; f:16657-18116